MVRPVARQGRANSPERGQSTVEFALCVPLVIIVLLMAIQTVVLAGSQLALTQATREIARAVAIDPQVDIGPLIDDLGLSSRDGLDIQIQFERAPSRDRDVVWVKVQHRAETVFPVFRSLLSNFNVRSEARMLAEL